MSPAERSDVHFALGILIDECERKHDFATTLRLCRQALPFVAAAAEECKKAWDHDIEVHAITSAVRWYACLGAVTDLGEFLDAARSASVPARLLEAAPAWIALAVETKACSRYIDAFPGCLQSELRAKFPSAPEFAHWWAKLGYIERVKSGRSYRLTSIRTLPDRVDYAALEAFQAPLYTAADIGAKVREAVQNGNDQRRLKAETERMIADSDQTPPRRRKGKQPQGCATIMLLIGAILCLAAFWL